MLAALLVGGLVPSGRPGETAAAPRPFNVTLLMTSDPGPLQDGVVTDGAVVAWADASGALFAYDLAAGRERRLLDGPARRSQLALAGGTLVWTERAAAGGAADGGAAIRGLRLAGGDPFTVAEGAGERNSPAIAGSTVVWRDRRSGNWDIYGYDLGARRVFPIAVDPTNQGAVAVAGSTVVWEDHRTGSWHLRGYDLTAQREFAITDGPDDDLAPAFDGRAVAFVRQRATGGFGALILRDLGSGEERTIVEGHPALRPGLDGNLVVWEDWGEGVPNVYAFDRESNRSFALARSEQARGPAVAGGVVAWLSKGQFSSRVTAIRLDRPLPSDPQDPPTVTDPDTRYFPESKHTLRGAFRNFWNLNGGLEIFGYPLTEAFEEPDARGVKRQVQYFERARLEADPQDPSRISIARLGAERATGRAFPTVAPFDDTPERAYFGQTGHSLGGAFKAYWENHGGLAAFGFPLSEELDEGVTVQYFERARFEFRPTADAPDRVALSLLGRDALLARGWLPVAPPQPLDR